MDDYRRRPPMEGFSRPGSLGGGEAHEDDVVEGHIMNDERTQDQEDTEGHRLLRQEDDTEGHRLLREGEEDDTEGHRLIRAADEDDTEGHRLLREGEEDDTEGHRAQIR